MPYGDHGTERVMADCFCPQEIIIGTLQNVLYHNVGTKVEVEVDQWPAFTSVIVRMRAPVLVVSKYQQILLVFSDYLCPPVFFTITFVCSEIY
jgi:hypothetical protein